MSSAITQLKDFGLPVWLDPSMYQHVCVEMTELLEQFPTLLAGVWFDAAVPQQVSHQVVLGGVHLRALVAAPTLLSLLVDEAGLVVDGNRYVKSLVPGNVKTAAIRADTDSGHVGLIFHCLIWRVTVVFMGLFIKVNT